VWPKLHLRTDLAIWVLFRNFQRVERKAWILHREYQRVTGQSSVGKWWGSAESPNAIKLTKVVVLGSVGIEE
jgi:hypothetical protein